MRAWSSTSNANMVDRDSDSQADEHEARADLQRREHFFQGVAGLLLAGLGGIGETLHT